MTSPQLRTQAISKLSTTLPQIFNDVQRSPNSMVRLSVSLRKIQEYCALNSSPVKGEPHDINEAGEAAFNKEYIRNVNKILPIRRREHHADSIVRFVATFLQFTQKQDNDEGAEDMDEEDQPETISSRFVRMLMTHILKGLVAKSLSVRLRCCQIIALSVSCLGELDEDLYQNLKAALYNRIKDKETSVRMQAVTALTRLQLADDEADSDDGRTIVEKLIWILQHDSSAEVRRVVIMHLEINETTLPFVIQRARDVDPLNRRLVFEKRLSELPDFQQIPSDSRFQLIKWGLSDRDKKVRMATGKMIADSWIKQADQNLLEFLERMDIMDGMVGGVSERMLSSLLELRMSSMSINFDEQFWENLSPESAFLANVYTDLLHSKKMENQLDDVLPEVTRHAFYIQHYNNLWHQATNETEGEYEFIVAQMLGVAKKLDYADEVGRRKMYTVLREMILEPDLPDDHLASLVELISLTAMDERDFTRIIIDVMSDIQDQAEMDDEETESSSKRLKLDGSSVKGDLSAETDPRVLQVMLAKLKCLSVCKFMLELCEESLQDNSTMYGILNQLVIPAVQSKEVVIREEGLHCLGLVCHLDKELALHNISLFIQCFRSGHDELRKKALKILFDMIMKYGYPTVSEKMKNAPALFEQCLDDISPEMQSIGAEGLAKLILSRSFKNDNILKLLVVLYFFPTTIHNTKLQQCLTYFFPAYCHSSSENQRMMANIALEALDDLMVTYLDLDESETMVAPNVIAEMLAHWTDPQPLAAYQRSSGEVDMSVQGKIAIGLLRFLHRTNNRSDVPRKTFCHMLTKLYLDELDVETMKTVLDMGENIVKETFSIEPMARKQVHKVMKHLKEVYDKLDTRESATTNTATPRTRESSISSMTSTAITESATTTALATVPETMSSSSSLSSSVPSSPQPPQSVAPIGTAIAENDDANANGVTEELDPYSDSDDSSND